MASAIQNYNLALSRIGSDQFIADPNEDTKAGDLYRLWYDVCVEAVLTDFPWNFASSVVALALVSGDPPPGWVYKYAYPIDCLAARRLSDVSGTRNLYVNTLYGWNCYDGAQYQRQPYPFQVMSEAATSTTRRRIIVTDLEQAYLFYTAKITDPNQFDASFRDALSWRIASEIAAPMLGAPTGPSVAQAAQRQYVNALMNAQAKSLNESTDDPLPDSIAVQARA